MYSVAVRLADDKGRSETLVHGEEYPKRKKRSARIQLKNQKKKRCFWILALRSLYIYCVRYYDEEESMKGEEDEEEEESADTVAQQIEDAIKASEAVKTDKTETIIQLEQVLQAAKEEFSKKKEEPKESDKKPEEKIPKKKSESDIFDLSKLRESKELARESKEFDLNAYKKGEELNLAPYKKKIEEPPKEEQPPSEKPKVKFAEQEVRTIKIGGIKKRSILASQNRSFFDSSDF